MEPVMKDRAATKLIFSEGTAFDSDSSAFSLDKSDKECHTPIDKDSSISTLVAKRACCDIHTKKPRKNVSSV